MKTKKVLLVILTLFLLTIPNISFSQTEDMTAEEAEEYLSLSSLETNNILTTLKQELYDKWIKLKTSPGDDSLEEAVTLIVREFVRSEVAHYAFKDFPVEVSANIIKESADIFAMGKGNIATFLEKFEEITVEKSVEYAMDYFLQNEIKASAGVIESKYKTNEDTTETAKLQYVISYHPLNEETAKIYIKIYSPSSLIPPTSKGSYSFGTGVLHNLNPGERIPPFTMTISGVATRYMQNNFHWEYDPEIEIDFPSYVPDFGLERKSFFQKYILDPFQDFIKGILKIGNSFEANLSLSGSEIKDFISYYQESEGEVVLEEDLFDFEDDKEDEEGEQEESENLIEEMEEAEPEEIIEEIEEETETSFSDQERETLIKIILELKRRIEEQNQEEQNQNNIIDQENNGEEEQEENSEEETENSQEEKKVLGADVSICEQSSNLIPAQNSVVINEVAWMGSETSSSDEWIELKNISDNPVDLSGWQLQDKNLDISIVFGQNVIIDPNDFLLLERTDDNSVSFKNADIIYSGSLANSNEELFLFNSSCYLEDKIDALSEWPAGDNDSKRTMERSSNLSWHNYSGEKTNGIWGTPKEENSPQTENHTQQASWPSGGGYVEEEISYCQLGTDAPIQNSVIVNEVAWMGSETSSSDEWIELKNISDNPVDLSGWQLQDRDLQIKVIFESEDTINPGEYYLLERTNDDSVPNIFADKIYTGALSDNDDALYLFSPSCQLQDKAEADPNWLAGDGDNKKSMERNTDLGWHTYNQEEADSISGLYATPRSDNSIEESEPEEDDTQITLEKSDHLLITQVQPEDEEGKEFIELYNPTDQQVQLCPEEENCFNICYFAATFDGENNPVHTWSNPSSCWEFEPNSFIDPGSYFLISVYGLDDYDLELKTLQGDPYQSGRLNKQRGSISLFSKDPRTDDNELSFQEKEDYALSLKIDALGWTDSLEPAVKEGSASSPSLQYQSLARKYQFSEQMYFETDDNSYDFESQDSTIKERPTLPPESVSDLEIIQGEYPNSFTLAWSMANDPDSNREDLTYQIYYSKNSAIDENNLSNISDYVSVEIEEDSGKMKAKVNDLYFNSTYYFAVKTFDERENQSGLSNIVQAQIALASPLWKMGNHDSLRSAKTEFSGPREDNIIETVSITENGEDVRNPPAIDQNGNVYLVAEIEGKTGVFAYDEDGNKKWDHEFFVHYFYTPAIGIDGTIYILKRDSIAALSPSGLLKWEENLGEITSDNPVIASNQNIYVMAKVNNMPHLFILSDLENSAQRIADYDLSLDLAPNDDLFQSSDLIVDSSNNCYLSFSNKLLKFSAEGEKINQRAFEPDYREGYLGEQQTAMPSTPYLAGNLILVSVANGYCYNSGERNICSNLFYAIDSSLEGDPLWTKEDYAQPFALNQDQFYFKTIVSGSAGHVSVNLYGADAGTGEIAWSKSWSFSGSPMIMSDPVIDGSGNIYFTMSGGLYGYDISSITSSDPEDARILRLTGFGSNARYAVSLKNDSLYFAANENLLKIVFK